MGIPACYGTVLARKAGHQKKSAGKNSAFFLQAEQIPMTTPQQMALPSGEGRAGTYGIFEANVEALF
jgi:hypothetical protein